MLLVVGARRTLTEAEDVLATNRREVKVAK
jgi:hypothetical protein